MAIQCLICEAERNVFLFQKENCDYYRCLVCEVVFIWPRQTAEANEKMYQQWGEDLYLDERKINHDYNCSFEERLAQLEPYRKKNRLLDVGCSVGAFLHSAKGKGWDAYGVELSRPSAEYAKNARGLNVFCGTLDSAKYENEFFDVVDLWAVLEHVLDPVGVLKEAMRVLRKGGLLVFCVPNYDCLPIRLLGRGYRYIANGHLFYFTKETVSRILEKVGAVSINTTTEYFSPFSFIEDLRHREPNTLNTLTTERKVVSEIKSGKFYSYPLRLIWKMLMFFIRKFGLGEELRVLAVKK